MEWTIPGLVDVRLIDFIGKEHKTLFLAKVDDFTHVFLAQALTSGVTRIDDHKGAYIDILSTSFFNRRLEILDAKTPVLLLFKIVWYRRSINQGKRGRIKRILRNRAKVPVSIMFPNCRFSIIYLHHDTAVRVLGQELQNGLDTRRSALSQVDMVGIGGITITTFNELGNILTDVGDTLGVGVRADTANIFKQQFSAGNGIGGIKF